MKRIINFSLLCSIIVSSHVIAETDEPILLFESIEEARAACSAWSFELGYDGCGLSYNSLESGYVSGGNYCSTGNPFKDDNYSDNLCYADSLIRRFYYPVYTTIDNKDNNKTCNGVLNPIDITTGNKIQREAIFTIDAIQPIVFDLYFNAQTKEKWRHSYSRTINKAATVYNLSGLLFDEGVQYLPNTDTIRYFGYDEDDLYLNAFVSSRRIGPKALSAKNACIDGWNSYKSEYHYPWVYGSTAQYDNGECRIKDSDGNSKVTLDIYNYFDGRVIKDVTHIKQSNKVNRQDGTTFSFSTDHLNLTTGESIEYIKDINDEITGYKLYTNIDEMEQFDSLGRLTSITSRNNHVQSLSYEGDTFRITKIENETGEYIDFFYELYDEVKQYKRINRIVDHSGREWSFFYNADYGNLHAVQHPDETTTTFHYENNNYPLLLTGITDRNETRYASWEYNEDGQAISSAHGESKDIDFGEITYYSNGRRDLTVSRKSKLTNEITEIITENYTNPTAGFSISEKTGHDPVQYQQDAMTGYIEQIEDKGLVTQYINRDNNGNPGAVIEAAGTAEQRQIDYTYDSRYHSKVSTKTEDSVFVGAKKVTTYQYDDSGNNISVRIDGYRPDGTAVTRSSLFKYDGPYHQLTQIDGPRTDVDDIYTIQYYLDDISEGYNRARMKNVYAPSGNAIYQNVTYTATGKIATYKDANNVKYIFSYYNGNNYLKTLVQHDLSTGQKQSTKWTYLATGEVKSVIYGFDASDKSTLTFNYDDARRLTGMTDGLGNSINYVLDSEGNVEQENIKDAAGYLRKQLTQTFDDYNRLQLRTQVNEQYTEVWSADGTLDKTVDGKNVTTDYSYDALRRLTQINQDAAGASLQTADAITSMSYDVQDNLTTVIDANGGQTRYVYDDLGNLISETSPDTGTRTYTHDEAGNILSLIDAKLQVFVYSYDAMNRLTNVDAPGTVDDITNSYDTCLNGVGLLCTSQRDTVNLSYQYNAFGDISALEQSIDTWPGYNQAVSSISYSYDTAGRLKNIGYPSGSIITYGYDASGNIDNVNLDQDGVITDLSKNISYQPFGEVSSQTYGNGLILFGYSDLAYRHMISGTPNLYFDYLGNYDANGNPTSNITLDTGLYLSQNYSYDEHDRLDTSAGLFGNFDYDYDKVGNRIQLIQDGVTVESDYQALTNRMENHDNETVILDANGNTQNIHGMSLAYTTDNRLKSVNASNTYQYNSLGQRVVKKVRNGVIPTTRVYLYGKNGELLAEIGPSGDVFREYVYLNGQPLALLEYTPSSTDNFLAADVDGDGAISVEDYILWYVQYYLTGDVSKDTNDDGLIDNNDVDYIFNCALTQDSCRAASYDTSVYYIHNDHLGTPKVLTNQLGNPVWQAVATPFGKATVDEDVDGDGKSVVMNMRFPGQYYDAESGLHYNYFRTYDPELGRYITSDPIGLLGGVNTFGYVAGNPIKNIDFLGLVGQCATWECGFYGGTNPDNVNAPSLKELNETTSSEVATALGVLSLATGVGNIVTGVAIFGDISIISGIGAAIAIPSTDNVGTTAISLLTKGAIRPSLGNGFADAIDSYNTLYGASSMAQSLSITSESNVCK